MTGQKGSFYNLTIGNFRQNFVLKVFHVINMEFLGLFVNYKALLIAMMLKKIGAKTIIITILRLLL